EGIGAAEALPAVHAPQADQLAEHLADLRSGDEVAARTERIGAPVVAVLGMAERLGHVLGDGDRPGQADAAEELSGERRHRADGEEDDAGCTGLARTMNRMPKISIGTDSTWPMVIPASNRKPSCSSGSRNSSAMMRAQL